MEVMKGNHRHGEELCRFYVRHFHIGRWILWTR